MAPPWLRLGRVQERLGQQAVVRDERCDVVGVVAARAALDHEGDLVGDQAARGGVDDDFAARSFENLGAWIMGRKSTV